MNFAMKWLATAVVAMGLLTGIRSAVAAETLATSSAPTADPAIWGVYAQLIGTEWSGPEGNAHWRWGPDNTIVESRTFQMKSVIRRGANRGELVSVYGGGLHTYDGRIAADGSILWVRRGRFLKMPSRVLIVDSRFVEEMVTLDDAGQVAKVGSIRRFEQTAGTQVVATAAPMVAVIDEPAAQSVQPDAEVEAGPVPAPMMPAPTVPAAAIAVLAATPAMSPVELERSPLPPPSRAVFGPYADAVGLSHITAEGYHIRWYQSSETAVVHEVRAPNGAVDSLQIIKTTGPGSLILLRSTHCPDGVCGQAGTVQDGVVHWKEPKASGGYSGGFMDTIVWMENGALVTHATDPSPSAIQFFEQYPHLKYGPVRLVLVPTPPLSPEQEVESRILVSRLEPLVELEVSKAISKQLATGQSIANAQAERQRSAEKVRSFNRLMGAVSGVLTEANEVATANEARSRAELDATLAQINASVEAQRQAQARAQQQAAEAQRKQLAENARWVAEKEQAAAEYRAGETQAAAAREAQLIAKQQEVEQRRVAADVDRRNAQQDALREQQRLQAQAAVTMPAPTPEAPAAQQVRQVDAFDAESSVSSASTPQGNQERKLHFFFINVGGVGQEFVGPIRLTPAEATEEWARVRADAATRYGSGAQVTKHATFGSYRCGYVYQDPSRKTFTFGSEQTLQLAAEDSQLKVRNIHATVLESPSCE